MQHNKSSKRDTRRGGRQTNQPPLLSHSSIDQQHSLERTPVLHVARTVRTMVPRAVHGSCSVLIRQPNTRAHRAHSSQLRRLNLLPHTHNLKHEHICTSPVVGLVDLFVVVGGGLLFVACCFLVASVVGWFWRRYQRRSVASRRVRQLQRHTRIYLSARPVTLPFVD